MTREEAIEILENTTFIAPLMVDVDTALDMAISALSDYDKMQKISLDLAFENDELMNKSRWIPVSENPKEYDRYLTYHKDGKMHVGTWGLFGWNYGHYVEDVIAWMPLPEPYKKGGE